MSWSARPGTERDHELVAATKHVITERFAHRCRWASSPARSTSPPTTWRGPSGGLTGFTVMGYLAQIRLRTALERLGEPGVDLARLALGTGVGSHSHLTDRFRAAFGRPPSAVRDAAAIAEVREASKNLEAARAGAS